MGLVQLDIPGGLESEGFEMLKTMMWSMLGLLITASAAQADFFYSPIGYYPAPVAVQPVYSAPIPVGISYAAIAAPVVVARPVYVSPVVQTVYSAPVYSAPISTVSYTTYSTPVVAAPVYVRPAVTVAPVVVPAYGVARESLIVRPYSSTYRSSAHGWGSGYSVYERNTPYRTVIRARGW